MNFMADFNEDAFPEHINGDAYTEVPIACPSDPHFAWDIAKVNVTSMTSGFDAMDQFLSLNNFCTSLETSTTKMMLPPSYLPGTWVYISQLQERMARLEHELAAIRSRLAATPRKVDTENVLALSEVATERPPPVAANTNSLTSLRQVGSRKVDHCMKRKYNRRPKRDINAPSRPLTAYAKFANDVRAQDSYSQLEFTQCAKQIGRLWQQCRTPVRERYLNLAGAEKRDYEASLLKYKTSKAFDQYQNYRKSWEAGQGRTLKAKQEWVKCEQMSAHLKIE